MLAILELPDKTAHKGLSCFSSNKVRPNHINDDINGARRAAAKPGLAIDGWRPTTARPPLAGLRVSCTASLPARVPARPPGRVGPMRVYSL
jgi:hypothetical protein